MLHLFVPSNVHGRFGTTCILFIIVLLILSYFMVADNEIVEEDLSSDLFQIVSTGTWRSADINCDNDKCDMFVRDVFYRDKHFNTFTCLQYNKQGKTGHVKHNSCPDRMSNSERLIYATSHYQF